MNKVLKTAALVSIVDAAIAEVSATNKASCSALKHAMLDMFLSRTGRSVAHYIPSAKLLNIYRELTGASITLYPLQLHIGCGFAGYDYAEWILLGEAAQRAIRIDKLGHLRQFIISNNITIEYPDISA